MAFEAGQALYVEIPGTTPAPSTLASALPCSVEYTGLVDELETGDELLDRYLGSGVVQVAINEQRWAAFLPCSGNLDPVVWLECDGYELENYRLVPKGTTIAWASGIEDESMTSQRYSWSVIDVGGGWVSFVADGDSLLCCVEERGGRTNLELAQALVSRVDWDPVSAALARAIELGGHFDGVASELDQELSDSCEVSASVEL